MKLFPAGLSIAVELIGKADLTRIRSHPTNANQMKGIMIASVDPAAIPTLTIGGIFFVAVYSLFGAYLWRHRQQWFGRDEGVEGDRKATRYLQIVVICIPLLIIAGRVFIELVEIG